MSTAKFEKKTAWLGTEFGESYARRLFGDAVIDSLPRYTKGKNTGKFKAEIAWLKCTAGGWVRLGAYDYDRGHGNGFVENKAGSTVYAVLRDGYTGERFAAWPQEYNYLYDEALKN